MKKAKMEVKIKAQAEKVGDKQLLCVWCGKPIEKDGDNEFIMGITPMHQICGVKRRQLIGPLRGEKKA